MTKDVLLEEEQFVEILIKSKGGGGLEEEGVTVLILSKKHVWALCRTLGVHAHKSAL